MHSLDKIRWALTKVHPLLVAQLEAAEEYETGATADYISALCMLTEAASTTGPCPLCQEEGATQLPKKLVVAGGDLLCQRHAQGFEFVVALAFFLEALHEPTRVVMKCKQCRWYLPDGEPRCTEYTSPSFFLGLPCRHWELYTLAPRARSYTQHGPKVKLVIWNKEED